MVQKRRDNTLKVQYLKVGCIFSEEFLNFIREINSITEAAKIYEVYGSTTENAFLTARSVYRLPQYERNSFEKYIMDVRDMGLQFNYTMNSSYIGSLAEIYNKQVLIKDYIKYLLDIGVSTITVSLPIVAELIREVDDKIGIEVSTIAHIDSIAQIQMWHEKYAVTKICNNVMKNREIGFLRNAALICESKKIVFTVIANEFCSNGTNNAMDCAGGCIYRDHCYSLQSEGYTGEDMQKMQGYPMSICDESRKHPVVWLKSNFIRPEDMKLYNELGINHFKITGRTASFEFMKKIIKAYMEQNWDGDLVELWNNVGHFGKGTKSGQEENKSFIPNKSLEGFLKYWFQNECQICSQELCGETCGYCNSYYEKYIRNFNF